jgi:Holliday junction resolvase RusA-like endonuclease
MTVEIAVVIAGQPVAQGRPRFTTRGGFPRAYDAPRAREWKSVAATLMLAARGRAGVHAPLAMALSVDVCAVFAKPKKPTRTWPGRPDLDNIIKAVGDAGNGILWEDDSAICRIYARKRYAEAAEAPCVEVSVRAIDVT